MSTMYLLMKTLHVVGVIVLIGTGVTSGFWKAWADKTGDAKVIAHTLDGLQKTNLRFIMPASLALLLGGFGAQGMAHYSLGETWLWSGILLFLIAAVAGMAGIGRTTRAARALFPAVPESGAAFDRERYAALSRTWKVWHTIVILAPVVAAVVMIFRPR
jgi:uncharacterized membrane protein